MKLSEYVNKDLLNKLRELNIIEPTPIQKELIPSFSKGKNVVGIAKTGSGKTLAYLLPIFRNIDSAKKEIQAVIICPTRELSRQVYEVCRILGESIGVKTFLAIGGEDISKQHLQEDSNRQILVSTPARLKKLHEQKVINFTTANYLVIDEIDAAFDLGFLSDLIYISQKMKPQTKVAVLSATINKQMLNDISRFVEKPEVFEVDSIWENKSIKHYIVDIKHFEKLDVISSLLKQLNPYLTMVFANTKTDVIKIFNFIKDKFDKVAMIHGDLPPRERKNIFRDLADDKFRILVTSDLSARGIDIPNISTIISYDIPTDPSWYIHRAGRTGRANSTGDSYLLYTDSQDQVINKLKSKGIEWNFKTLDKNLILIDYKYRPKPKINRKLTTQELKIRRTINLHTKKVKPGYKKDLRAKIAKIKQVNKRIRIEEDVRRNLKIKWKKQSAAKRKQEE